MIKFALALFLVGCANAQSSTLCVGQPQYRFVAHETDCWRYYTCVDGQAFLQECPDPFVFVESTQMCDFGDRNACVTCPAQGIQNFPVANSCTKFIQCIEGSQFQRECPAGTQFDASVGQCNIASVVGCVDLDCPAQDDPNNPVFKPDPTDCQIYYICLNGEGVKQTCPPQTRFNPALGVCDLLANVPCPNATQSYEGTCTGNQIFDITSKSCGPVKQSTCIRDVESAPQLPPSPAPATPSSPIASPPSSHLNNPCRTTLSQGCPELRACFPNTTVTVTCASSTTPTWIAEASEIDCSIFNYCFNGIGIQMCCPIGMYFNPILSACDDQINVDCQIEPLPCPETTTIDVSSTTVVTGTEDTTVTDITVTTTPIDTEETTTDLPNTTTENGNEETTTNTEEETTSSITNDDTTTQENITTDLTSESVEDTTTETEKTTTVSQEPNLDALCAAQPSDSFVELPYPGECTKYVLCENQQYLGTETCPAGLQFNPTLSVCDSPDHAECLDYVCKNNPDGSQIEFESRNSCQMYFICIGHTTIVRFCAPGTIYDSENRWCSIDDADYPCERERPPPPPESVIVQCTEDTNLNKIIHPTLCDVYYRCLSGQLWVRQCASGLFFDPLRQQCNLEEVVSCEMP
ncbi:uncharacterized protein LOC128725307 [Anopheles nili]|uniref:uncharacterized protein LOC128725307 n=1 Tax=Anopheles nili TaxID=185578 RepID=UPI00237BC5DB|nr:uncharacterized protein LOC128725307 [Anopheles nili]